MEPISKGNIYKVIFQSEQHRSALLEPNPEQPFVGMTKAGNRNQALAVGGGGQSDDGGGKGVGFDVRN